MQVDFYGARFRKKIHALEHIALSDATCPRKESGKESEVNPHSIRKSLIRVSASTKLSGFTCCLSVALVTKKHKYFSGICDATGGSAIIPPTPGLGFHKNSMFLHSLLKSAASAVLKFTSAATAVAHVRSVSIKQPSVTTIMFK